MSYQLSKRNDISESQVKCDILLKVYWNGSAGFSGNITRRIVWSIIIVVVMFIATVALAMLDSSNCKLDAIKLFYLRLQNLHQGLTFSSMNWKGYISVMKNFIIKNPLNFRAGNVLLDHHGYGRRHQQWV